MLPENILKVFRQETQLFSSRNLLTKIWDFAHLKYFRIVAIAKNQIIGGTSSTPVSGRCVYAGVAEVSIYVTDSLGLFNKYKVENYIM